MLKNAKNIPFVDLTAETSAFLIRPLLREINPETLYEKPHRHNFQEIIWVKKGTGKHTIDDKTLHLKPCTFYLISQGQVHEFMEGRNLDGFLIRFSNDFLPGAKTAQPTTFYVTLLSKISPVNEITLQKEEGHTFELLLNQILEEYQAPPTSYGKESVIQHLLLTLLIKLERKSRDLSLRIIDEADQDKKLYLKFLQLLEENYFRDHSLHSYASQLGTMPRKLSDVIKSYSGKAAKQLMLERTMLEAKRMLTYTDCNLKDITYNLGFEDPAYFSRIFKKQTNLTPLEYKKKKRNSV